MGKQRKSAASKAKQQKERMQQRRAKSKDDDPFTPEVSSAEKSTAFMGLAPSSEEKPLAMRLASLREKNPLNASRLAPPRGSLCITCVDMPPSSDSPPWVCTPPRVPSPKLGVAGQSKLVREPSFDGTSIIESIQKVQEYETQIINNSKQKIDKYNTEQTTDKYNTEQTTDKNNTEQPTNKYNTEQSTDINSNLASDLPKNTAEHSLNVVNLESDIERDAKLSNKKESSAFIDCISTTQTELKPKKVRTDQLSNELYPLNIVKVDYQSTDDDIYENKLDNYSTCKRVTIDTFRDKEHGNISLGLYSKDAELMPDAIGQAEFITEKDECHQVCLNELCLQSSNFITRPLIVQGSFHQGDKRFGQNVGKQCVANCLAAVIHSKLRHIEQWDQKYLDNVLVQGNEIYTWINNNNDNLLVTELPEVIEVSNLLVQCNRKESIASILDVANAVDFNALVNALPLELALQESLIDTDGCFICVKGFTSVVIKQDRKLFLFDSHARNIYGMQDTSGSSILIELQDVNHLYQHLCNFVQFADNVEFEITGISIQIEEMGSLIGKMSAIQSTSNCKMTQQNNPCVSDEEVSGNVANSNISNEKTNLTQEDVEVLSCTVQTRYNFNPIDHDLKRKLCSIVKIQSKNVTGKGSGSFVNDMGPPSKVKSIESDGNCLFRALSYAISQRQEHHLKVRKAIVTHSLAIADKLQSFIAPSTIREHITSTKMIENNSWGTEIEIITAADLLNTDIYTFFQGQWIKYSTSQICFENRVNDKAIYLNHYNNHYEVVTEVDSRKYEENEINESGKRRTNQELNSNEVSKKFKMETDLNLEISVQSPLKRRYSKKDDCSQSSDEMSYDDLKFHVYQNKRSKADKEKIMYQNFPEFKARKLSAVRQKYITDTDYRKNRIEIGKETYRTDKRYQANLKKSSRNKYSSSTDHRERVKQFSKLKYATDNEHCQNVKIASTTKYATNTVHKQNVKVASITKYATDNEHQHNVKNASIAKYATDIDHKENVKVASITKYATDLKHKQNVKVASKTKYATDNEHRQNVKNASITKYATDVDHRQYVKQQTKEKRKQKKDNFQQIDKVLESFNIEAKRGPENVCSCCLRLCFQNQVKRCNQDVYAQKNEQVKNMAQKCISKKYWHQCMEDCIQNCEYKDSSRAYLWICFTCHRKIMNGELPAESFANGLELEDVPMELDCLNTLEQHLIALNIPFTKVLALPKGGQKGVHGPVVCVPSDINKVTSSLPRSLDENCLLRVKLKRKLCYKGYEEYQFINPKHLEVALSFLKENNHWYSVINVDKDWTNPIEESKTDNTDIDIQEVTDENAVDSQLDSNDRTNIDESADGKQDLNITDEIDSYLDDGLRGVQLDTCLQPADIGQEVLDQCFDQVFNLSPAEGNNPISILKEDGIEAKSFPVHYPSGKNTLNEEREKKLSLLRYFNLRLTSVDNRFARDTSYIFFCQYMSELDRVISSVQISLRKESPYSVEGKKVTSSMLCNKELLRDFLKKDQAIKYLKPVRGTPPYWQATQKDIFAMIRQLGVPTFFCSFSSADFRWSEIIETIMKQQGDTRKIEDLDWNQKCQILRSNPVTTARMFDHRFHSFLHDVILTDSEPIGKVVDYFYRVEFQQRGSPHTHCLFWVDKAPKFNEDDDQDVLDFIDKYITCEIPEKSIDPVLHEIVTSVHQHSKKHSKSCRKKGTVCRFNFPRPPSNRTFISRPNECEENENEAKERLSELWNQILDENNEGMSTNDLFEKANMTQSEFEKYFDMMTKRNTVVLKRSLTEIYTNQYNQHLLRGWNANMDIQYVLDVYSCVVYIISYISKAERELGLLLQQTRVEAKEGNLDAQQTMRKIGTAYLHHREISAQEAVYRVTGLKLKECSRKVEFIPIGDNPCKMSVPLKVLEERNKKKSRQNKCSEDNDNDDDDEDENSIWMTSIVDRYIERPQTEMFDKLCLAKFCSDYNVLGESQVPKKINEATTFKLGKDLGYIRKRTRTSPGVIRYPRFSVETNSEKYFQSILQLFLPYRKNSQLKPIKFETYENFYQTGFVRMCCSDELVSVKSIVDENMSDFVKNEEALDHAEKDLEERGVQEDAWGQLCAEAEVERHECIEEGSESTVVEKDHSDEAIPDLNKQNKSDATNLLSQSFQRSEYIPLLRALNYKQRQIFYKVRDWCLKKANGEKMPPFHVFITGGGGTGKSHLIKCLYYEATRLLARSTENPDDITVLLTAPTGVAAFNINGMTIHSALSIFKRLSTEHTLLSEDRINTLRSKLETLQILIVDEVSMVSKRLLFFIHERLRQVKKVSENNLFGGVSIIAVGDFFQLPPVKTKKSDKLYVDDPSSPINHLWNGLFDVVELDEVMRQREDSVFAQILNRLRIKKKNESIQQTDLQALKQCMTNGPDEALHIFPTNAEVDAYNNERIMKLNSDTQLVEAEDFEKMKTSGKLIKRKSQFSDSSILLPSSILIAEGARVMVTKNIDTEDGLVNGVIGTVASISQTPAKGLPKQIFVNFDNRNVGKNAKCQKTINGKICIGLEPSSEDIQQKNGIRKQYPLRLAWACTVHKVQGLTVTECVVDITKCFAPGQAYVALSRVTSMSGLHIREIDETSLNSKIFCDPDVDEGLLSMTNFLHDVPSTVDENCISIMYHNIQGLRTHIEDLASNIDFKKVDYVCLTETWLNSEAVVQIKEYQFEHLPRSLAFDKSSDLYTSLKELQHGGVGVFYKTGTILEQVDTPFLNLECIVFKILKLNMVVATIYRTQKYPTAQFLENMHLLLEKLFHLTDKLVVVGDFNQDILKGETMIEKFMKSKGFIQLAQTSTTEMGTLIDHVYTKGCSDVKVAVIPTYYSYHDAISIKISNLE